MFIFGSTHTFCTTLKKVDFFLNKEEKRKELTKRKSEKYHIWKLMK